MTVPPWANESVNDTPANEFLSSERDFFKHAFDHAAVGMALVGLEGEFLNVNRALCRLVEYPEEELKRLTFFDITYAQDLEFDIAQSTRLLAGEIANYSLEKRCITRTGRLIWVRLNSALARDQHGTPLFFIEQIEEVTNRKSTERERDEFFQLPLFFHAVIGFDGFLKRVNPTWLNTFGYTMEEWANTAFLDFIHPDDKEAAVQAMEGLREQKDLTRLKLRFRCADGQYLSTVWCARGDADVFYASGFDETPMMDIHDELKQTLREKTGLLAELQRTQAETNNLRSKLLTICAWTKRVRCNDQWMSVDEFLINELGLTLNHGMSAEAEEEFFNSGAS